MRQDDWISANERLPKPSSGCSCVVVLVTVNDPSLLRDGEPAFIDIATYWRDRGIWTISCRSADRSVSDFPVQVSHWMPLPAPPTVD
ncbi:hypothetical protein PTE30175_01845 [Pandoraea terrae]|uniref:DUF551 domain-containing protein n=1 Tax=Pandoraea terrae TaxID=1537710 RepID=A0A5E4U9M7_9BURK|nr:hypothetical protein PTE30175_01845 [Pandoraea terrae]